jgi:serine/threonine-protein kinase
LNHHDSDEAGMAEFLRGRYVSAEFLGNGSMGRVYVAHPRGEPGRKVVVKVMHAHVAAQPNFRAVFDREMQSMARLRHPYIVRLLDSSVNDPAGPCLVMEHIPGVTLEKYLEVAKRLPVGHVGLLLGYLCHALESAHALGIVHRDLKPANLMIVGAGTQEEALRVMDFGLAQLSDRPHITLERLAGAAHVAAEGTPGYMCPEQLRGDETDARSDIYSVGVILYELLVGQLPFQHTDVKRLLRAHVHERPLGFAVAGARHLPHAVEKVVMLCLSKFGVERPTSARELARQFSEAIDIDIWEATQPEVAPEPPRPPALRRSAPFTERNVIVRQLDAWMPERIAVVKLRGFLEDKGGRVTASEPGLLRIRLGEPNKDVRPKVLGQPAPFKLPVEIELRMEKPDPKENLLNVTILFRPFTDPILLQVPDWRKGCDILYKDLQSYLMAR